MNDLFVSIAEKSTLMSRTISLLISCSPLVQISTYIYLFLPRRIKMIMQEIFRTCTIHLSSYLFPVKQ